MLLLGGKKLGTLEKVACWTKIKVPLLCMQVVCAWREIQIVNKLCTASGLLACMVRKVFECYNVGTQWFVRRGGAKKLSI